MFSITILPVPIRLFISASIILAILSAGCGVQVPKATSTTATPLLNSATLPATLTQASSETPLPPPPQPTVAPVEGVTSTQINVRAEPSTAGKVLGMIPGNTKVEITGKDPGGNWWQINYSQAADGKGWVTAQYVTTAAKPEVPTIGGNQANPNSGNVAVVQQQIHVRSGPGTGFNSLGTLNPQDVVTLIGKDSNGAWLQIDFAAGPEGKGWVNAAFVQARGADLSGLPIVAETGLVVGTGTPTLIPSTPTPTVLPALADGDSPNTPIVSVVFEPTGTHTFMYNGNVSSPQGDTDDWVAFKPYSPSIFISLACRGSDSLKVEMTENSLPLNTYINCGGQIKKITVRAGSNYLVHLQAAPAASELQYTSYTLTIKMEP